MIKDGEFSTIIKDVIRIEKKVQGRELKGQESQRTRDGEDKNRKRQEPQRERM